MLVSSLCLSSGVNLEPILVSYLPKEDTWEADQALELHVSLVWPYSPQT